MSAQLPINFRTRPLIEDLRSSGALLEYTPEAYARLKAIQGPIEKRRPENAHLRKLWDAKQRMAEQGDWEAYKNIEKTIRLYKEQPEILEEVS